MELKPAARIGVGAIGKPGKRTFYLVATGTQGSLALKCEKFQVEALAARLDELLSGIASELGKPRRTDFDKLLEEIEAPEAPAKFDWVVGEMGIGYDPEEDLVLLVARSSGEDSESSTIGVSWGSDIEDANDDGVEVGEGSGEEEARIWITRSQAEVLALQSAAVAVAGRKLCPFCTMPIDPEEGHDCFARNGHKKARLTPGGD